MKKGSQVNKLQKVFEIWYALKLELIEKQTTVCVIFHVSVRLSTLDYSSDSDGTKTKQYLRRGMATFFIWIKIDSLQIGPLFFVGLVSLCFLLSGATNIIYKGITR
jgi:hypothetical protein